MRKYLVSVSLLLASATSLAAAPASSQPAAQPAPQLAAATPAAAPSAEHLALARRFVALRNQDQEFIDLVHQGFWSGAGPYLAAIEDETKRDAATEQAEAMFARLEPTIRKRIPTVSEAYARAYAAKFSAAQLGELVAFGSTPTGKYFLSNILALEADPIVSEAAISVMEELTPALMEFQKKACTDHAQQRIAMGDKKATCPLSADPQVRSL